MVTAKISPPSIRQNAPLPGVIMLPMRRGCSENHFEACKELRSRRRKFICIYDICPAKFVHEVSRDRHMKNIHTKWVPQKCNGKGEKCNPSCASLIAAKYDEHLHAEHNGLPFEPTVCRYPGCMGLTKCTLKPGYRTHLIRKHRLSGKDLKHYLETSSET